MSLGLRNNCRRQIPFYFEMIERPFVQRTNHNTVEIQLTFGGFAVIPSGDESSTWKGKDSWTPLQ